jgi:hypothetical protein
LFFYAEKLSQGFEHLRVDMLYRYSDDKIFISEVTQYHGNGTNGFPDEIDEWMGTL